VAYRIKTTVSDDRTITLSNLPFQAGEKIEVIIREDEAVKTAKNRYPLRGTPVEYQNPFDGVADDFWIAAQ